MYFVEGECGMFVRGRCVIWRGSVWHGCERKVCIVEGECGMVVRGRCVFCRGRVWHGHERKVCIL
jgi:hypothetical protein